MGDFVKALFVALIAAIIVQKGWPLLEDWLNERAPNSAGKGPQRK